MKATLSTVVLNDTTSHKHMMFEACLNGAYQQVYVLEVFSAVIAAELRVLTDNPSRHE